MRAIALAAAVLAVAAAGACSKPVDHLPGNAQPITAVTTPSGAGAAAATTTTTPTPSSTPSSAPATSPPAKTSTANTLGAHGYGALKLGMTQKQAMATGLVTDLKPLNEQAPDGMKMARIKGSEQAEVVISPTLGIEIIEAFGDVRTPAGIHLGSTRTELLKAYPTWHDVVDGTPDGRGYGPAAGNPKAHYRIVTAEGKVIQLSLELVDQDVHE